MTIQAKTVLQTPTRLVAVVAIDNVTMQLAVDYCRIPTGYYSYTLDRVFTDLNSLQMYLLHDDTIKALL